MKENVGSKSTFRKLSMVMVAFLCLMAVNFIPSGMMQRMGFPLKVEARKVPAAPTITTNSSFKDGRIVTWDCVYFGTYPQTEIINFRENAVLYGWDYDTCQDYEIDNSLYEQLRNTANWNIKNETTINNVKYKRIQKKDVYSSNGYGIWKDSLKYRYFRYEPIKWRVLKVNNGTAMLVSDKILDTRKYHEQRTDVSWPDSTLRCWLNGYDYNYNNIGYDYSGAGFLQTAFTSQEQGAIRNTVLYNEGDVEFGTVQVDNSIDKIFVPRFNEVCESVAAENYGFHDRYSKEDEARKREVTGYANVMGQLLFQRDTLKDVQTKNLGYWWLRSMSDDYEHAHYVAAPGYVADYGIKVNEDYMGVCPALYLDLSKTDLYSYAGTVRNDGIIYDENNKRDLASCKVTLSQPTFTANGEAKTPSVYVKYKGKKLEKGKDFKLLFYNNIKPGYAMVIVKGIGSYTGKVSEVYTIRPQGVALTSVENPQGRDLQIKWEKNTKVDGYEIKFSTQSTFADCTYRDFDDCNITDTTIENRSIGKRYYVRIRTYIEINGDSIYSKWSEYKSSYIVPPVKLNSVTNPSAGVVKLSWTKSDYDIKGYEVVLATDSDFSKIANKETLSKTTTSKQFTGKTVGKTYYARIHSYTTNKDGDKVYSQWSPTISIKVTK